MKKIIGGIISALFLMNLISCKSMNTYPTYEERSQVKARKDAPIEIVIKTKQGDKCSTSQIFECLEAKKGKTCLSECRVTSKYFCEKTRLKKCLDADGGENACHAKYCHGGGNGEFMSLALLKERKLNPNSLAELENPDDGVGYGFYDPLKTGTNRTLVRIQELARRVFRRSGYPMYIGDLSNKSGGNSGRHAGHIGGKEFDVGVMGNTPATFVGKYNHKGYNRNASRIMIEEAIKMGGLRFVYFNDPVLIKEFPGKVRWAAGHADHYHFYWDAD